MQFWTFASTSLLLKLDCFSWEVAFLRALDSVTWKWLKRGMGYKQKFKNIRPSVQLAPCCLLTACRSECLGKGERGTSMRNNSPLPGSVLWTCWGLRAGQAVAELSPVLVRVPPEPLQAAFLFPAFWQPFLLFCCWGREGPSRLESSRLSFMLLAVWWDDEAEQLIPVHSPCALWLYKLLSCTSLRSLFSRLSSLSFCQMTSVILLWTLSLLNFFLRWAHQSHLRFAIWVTQGFA